MVEGKRLNNLAVEMTSGAFKIISGISKELGGDNEGPSPHELLEAALTACTIMTLQMYANRKQMKLSSCNVTVEVESESAQASVMTRKIQLEGELSIEERGRLLEIANKCPIHKLLSSKITINSSLY